MFKSFLYSIFILVLFLSAEGMACDTWVALPDATKNGHTLLGKNSDRTNFDCQPLFFHPRQQWPDGSVIDLGRITVPQVDETYATLGSSPYWCFGYEEGINEFGVAIGNEGIRTKPLLDALTSSRGVAELGPTGMDLIRLGLERGRTAHEAMAVITGLLEEYGQFGSGLPCVPTAVGAYDNSFIIADAKEAWILETAGREWVARRVASGIASISNTTSITTDGDLSSSRLESYAENRGWWKPGAPFDFTGAYGDETPIGAQSRMMSVPRAECSANLLKQEMGKISVPWMMSIARDRSSAPTIDRDNTASASVAVLPESGLPVFWWCPARPSNSCFVPFFVHGSGLPDIVSRAGKQGRQITPPSKALPDSYLEDSYWWRFRALCDKVNLDDEERNRLVRLAFDPLEASFETGLGEVLEKAAVLRENGKAGEAARVLDAYTASCLERVLETLDELEDRFDGKVQSVSQELRLEKLVGELEAKRKEHHIPGMAIAVVKDGDVVLAQGFGSADLENKKPVTPETLFAIGSTTKAFTATLISMLVDDGLMQWDDPVTKYLPYFELHEGREVTIRDLLCHRTGFTRMSMLFANGRVPREEILRTASGAEPWAGFREKFYYNNAMFLAAGISAGKAAGSDWDTLIQKRIFDPLGMTSSNTSIHDCLDDRLSLGYEWDREGKEFRQVPTRDIGNIAPAGAINSSVLDMAKWIRFQLDSGAQLEETWTSQIEIAEGVGYGLGWMVRDRQGQLELEHGGNIDGFGAQVALLPESRLGFVLLTNVTATPLQSLSREVVWNAMLGDWKVDQVQSAKIDYKPYLGEYMANFGQFVDAEYKVVVQNDRLAIDVPRQMVYELKDPDEEGRWRFAFSDDIAVSFVRDDMNRVVAMKQYQHGLELELPRKGVEIPPEVPLDEVQKFLGAYYSEEHEETAQVVIKNNQLALSFPDAKTYMLRAPDGEGRWYFRVVDICYVTFDKGDDDLIEGLAYHQQGSRFTYKRRDKDSDPLPTVEEILALRESSASAMKSLSSYKLSGKARLPQCGLEGTVTVHGKGTERFRRDTDFGKYGSTTECVDGQDAWSRAPHGRIDRLEGKFLEQARHDLPAALLGDWREFFEEILVLSTEEGVHVLNLKGREAPDWTVHVDAKTGDVVKSETLIISQSSAIQLPVITRYEHYEEKEGVRMPHRIISTNEAVGKTMFEIDGMEINGEVDDAFFSYPSSHNRHVNSFDRIWQLIHDQYWDPKFNGVDWAKLREELRPRVERARTPEEARAIMNELISSLGISHCAVFPAEEKESADDEPSFGVTGIDLRVIEGQALVTSVASGSPAAASGVKPGWKILAVDRVDLAARLQERMQRIGQGPERELELAYSVLPLMMGAVGDEVSVRFLDEHDQEVVQRITLAERKGRIVDLGHIKGIDVWIETKRIGGDIGYIAFNRFFEPAYVMAEFNKAMASFLDTQGVIIDIRGNEGGLPEMALGMMGWLMEEQRELGTVFLRDFEYKQMVRPRAKTYQGPVALLIDGLCGSASEFMAAGLKDLKRAKLIGTRTKGEVLPGKFEKLENGDILLYTTDDYVCVSGFRPEGQGVPPDLEVHPTREALLEGRDLAVEAAVQWIRNQTVN